jgi:hypothetical protein
LTALNYIYHGTSAATARIALEQGLRPRGQSAGNGWGLFSAMPDRVYLTKDAPLYYAAMSVNDPSDLEKLGAVIRLDLDSLDASLLRPDEDYFYLQNVPFATREEIKTYHDSCKDRTDQNPEMWQESFQKIGSIAYVGVIPANAILDAKFVDFSFYSVLHAALGTLGEKVADRTQVVSIHKQLMSWLYSRNRLQSGFIDTIAGLAAENLEIPVEHFRRLRSNKIHNLRDRTGLSFRARPS